MTTTRDGLFWNGGNVRPRLHTDAVVKGNADLQTEYDVIVIGAGWAGLIAARDLSQQTGLKVLLIEARDRIGGRTWTAKELGQEFEMGGNWVMWTQPHVWHELHRYNMQKDLVVTTGALSAEKSFWKPISGPAEKIDAPTGTGNPMAGLEEVVQEFFHIDGHTSRTLMPWVHDPFREPAPWKKYDHMTVQDRLDQLRAMNQFSEQDLKFFEIITSGIGLSHASHVSFTEFLIWFALAGHTIPEMIYAGGVYKIGNGGMSKLALKVFGEYEEDTAMSSVVSKIEQNPSGETAKITLEDGRTFTAGKVICTVPLNCLSDVKFEPPLSEKRHKAILIGHINLGRKLHFQNKHMPAWSAYTEPGSSAPLNVGLSDHNDCNNGFSLAFGYTEGSLDLTDQAAVRSALEAFFPDDEKPNISAYLTHDWKNDRFAKGAWCTYGPGFISEYQQELQKDHGNIMFVSADWAEGWRGFVDGAIGSGMEAARRIIEDQKE